MSLPPTMKVARVKTTGKCYVVIAEGQGKVRCKGEILRVSGASTMHESRDKVFLSEKVEVFDTDRNEKMLWMMANQCVPKLKENRVKSEPKPRKPKQHPLANFVYDAHYGKKWGGKGYWTLTEKAEKQLRAEGEDIAWDGLGNYLDENVLQDAACDAASYHSDFTEAGMPEGFNQGREVVADMIYEGMLRGLKRVKDSGRSTQMPKEY